MSCFTQIASERVVTKIKVTKATEITNKYIDEFENGRQSKAANFAINYPNYYSPDCRVIIQQSKSQQ